MGCTFVWVKMGNAFAYFFISFHVYQADGAILQYKYRNTVHFDCKTKLLVQAIYDKYEPNLEQIATKMK